MVLLFNMIKNANKIHRDSMSSLDKVAVVITNMVGTMWCAMVFTVLALISLPAAIHGGWTKLAISTF